MRNMYGLSRKKQQSILNKAVKALNKNIEYDDVWKGRFYARQFSAGYHEFSDGSGGILYVQMRLVDKKTNLYFDVFSSAPELVMSGKLWWEMNAFIVEKVNTFIAEARKDPVDYRSVFSDPLKAKAIYPQYEGATYSYKKYD